MQTAAQELDSMDYFETERGDANQVKEVLKKIAQHKKCPGSCSLSVEWNTSQFTPPH
jgi:hypothetical protein